ncbi:MAG: hypothetical protein JXA10_07470 [Anaerolineae bacterium]|nr:hypothetical protein [Anaerolineae bacterium]
MTIPGLRRDALRYAESATGASFTLWERGEAIECGACCRIAFLRAPE